MKPNMKSFKINLFKFRYQVEISRIFIVREKGSEWLSESQKIIFKN